MKHLGVVEHCRWGEWQGGGIFADGWCLARIRDIINLRRAFLTPRLSVCLSACRCLCLLSPVLGTNCCTQDMLKDLVFSWFEFSPPCILFSFLHKQPFTPLLLSFLLLSLVHLHLLNHSCHDPSSSSKDKNRVTVRWPDPFMLHTQAHKVYTPCPHAHWNIPWQKTERACSHTKNALHSHTHCSI